MGSIVHLDLPFRQPTAAARHSALADRFAHNRRSQNDVFWLKENAELLNIFESTQAALEPDALAPFEALYASMEQRLGFFPQYYRFLLSLCLDLEDLGLDHGKGEHVVDWAVAQDLPAAELSDLQRAEARRLCLRRDVDPFKNDAGLDDRLRAFGTRSDTFALPNKKAAYELTHIVFYLSEYGRRDPDLPDSFVNSLKFVGTLAFLELNIDLLAEVCIALRFAGRDVPDVWARWLNGQAERFILSEDAMGWQADAYHPYLMAQWYLRVAHQSGFAQQIPKAAVSFVAPRAEVAPLREMSESLYAMADQRSADWETMRGALCDRVSDAAFEVIETAAGAVDFNSFFAGFARATPVEARA